MPEAWSLLARDLRPFAQTSEERQCTGRIVRGSECLIYRLNVSIELERAFAVHLYNRAIEFEAGKHAACARIAQHLRAHLPIGVGCGMTTDRAGGNSCVSPEFEL